MRSKNIIKTDSYPLRDMGSWGISKRGLPLYPLSQSIHALNSGQIYVFHVRGGRILGNQIPLKWVPVVLEYIDNAKAQVRPFQGLIPINR